MIIRTYGRAKWRTSAWRFALRKGPCMAPRGTRSISHKPVSSTFTGTTKDVSNEASPRHEKPTQQTPDAFPAESHTSSHTSNDGPSHIFTDNLNIGVDEGSESDGVPVNDPPISSQEDIIAGIPSQSASSRLSQLIYGFFRKESHILAASMKIDEALQSQAAEEFPISIDLREKLAAQFDDYNRFVLLASYHPLAIPHQLLLRYYSQMPGATDADREALLKTLVFCNAWDELWTVSSSDSTTLTDLEDLVDYIHTCLCASHNTDLGVWLAVSAAHNASSSKNVFASLREIFEYKCGIPRAKMDLFCNSLLVQSSTLDPEQQLQLLDKSASLFSEHVDFKAYLIIKIIAGMNKNNVESFVIEQYKMDPRLQSVLGFASSVLEVCPSNLLADLFAGRIAAFYNDADLYHISKLASPKRHEEIFMSFCRNSRRGRVTSEYVINHLVLQMYRESSQVALQLVQKYYKVLTASTFQQICVLLVASRSGRSVLRKVNKKQSDKFHSIVRYAIKKQMGTSVLLSLLESSTEHGREVPREILHHLDSSKNTFRQAVDIKLSEYNLTEVWRYGIRARLLDEETAGRLLERIIEKSWNMEELERRARCSGKVRLESQFQDLYRFSTLEERHRLLTRIRTIGQAISVAEPGYIGAIFNYVYGFFYRGNSSLVLRDKFGKDYVIQNLMKHTCHFIYHAYGSGAIQRMKTVLEKLDFDSIHMRALMFKYIAMDKPRVSVQILKTYEHKKALLSKTIMDGIEQGILESKNLTGDERLECFQKFQLAKKELGFERKLSRRTVAKMGKIVAEISNMRNDKDQLQSVTRLALDRGVPLRVVMSWSKEVK